MGADIYCDCDVLFAFSSVVGNYYYGETNIEFIKTSKTWLNIYRVFVVVMVVYGCLADFQIVWDMANLFMGLLALINLVAILLLSNVAYKIYKDYAAQRKKVLILYSRRIRRSSSILKHGRKKKVQAPNVRLLTKETCIQFSKPLTFCCEGFLCENRVILPKTDF